MSDSETSSFENLTETNGDEKPESASRVEEEVKKEAKEPSAEQEKETEKDAEGWEDLLGSGRIRKRILEPAPEGNKGRPANSCEVDVELAVFFEEKEVLPKHKLTFFLNESEVPHAVDLVVAVMEQGELAEVISDPDFAYGKLGLPENGLPPEAATKFLIKLLDFRDPVDPLLLNMEAKMIYGRNKKSKGNEWYKREEYRMAIQCYRKAAEFFDDEEIDLDVPIDRFSLSEELQELLSERVKTFNNLAQCQMKVELHDAAMASIKQVLKIEPNNEKALYRKSRILQQKLCLDEAVGILRRIQRLYPDNTQAKSDLQRLTARQKKFKENEQKLSKKMLGLDKLDSASKNGSKSWLKIGLTAGLILGSIGAAALAVAHKYRII